ncbi:MAG: TlpA family protein disulfide reductase [Bacteroidales bacterium]|nr:TlpA family protein disulfide reductase [Bacteroidales bacterium]
MKRNSLHIALLALAIFFHIESRAQEPAVFNSATEYFDSLVALPSDSISARVDNLILQGGDKKMMAGIAGLAFDYFSASPVMGHDAVAVHIADRWFLSHELEWSNQETFPMLYTYAEFNRQSLIGKPAPELNMESYEGGTVSTRNGDGSYKILYFYDETCATCREQTRQLTELLKEYKGEPLTLFAINSMGDRSTWKPYIDEYFGTIPTGRNMAVYNLTDPEDSNNWRMKYGVLKTPTMLLVNPDNVIIGRQLDCEALASLMKINNAGASGYRQLFDGILAALAPADSTDVSRVTELLLDKASADPALQREMLFELYKYLRNQQNFEYQKAAAFIANEYIVPSPSWSEELRSSIGSDAALFRTNSVGDKAVNVTLRRASDGKRVKMLRGCHKYTLLFFHLTTCSDCKREVAILRENADKLRRNKVHVVCVNVGFDDEFYKEFIEENDSRWVYLKDDPLVSGLRHKQYDIRFVPEIYLLDRNRKIIARGYDAAALAGTVL